MQRCRQAFLVMLDALRMATGQYTTSQYLPDILLPWNRQEQAGAMGN